MGIWREIFTNQRTSTRGSFKSVLISYMWKGSSSLMRLAMIGGFLKGVKISRSGPRVSYLLFADDCILFREATHRGVNLFQNILREYRSCLG